MDTTQSRRSTRARQAKQKYNIDPLKGLDLRASSDSGSTSSTDKDNDDSAEDENFAAHNSAEEDLDDDIDSPEGEDYLETEPNADNAYPAESLLDDDESVLGSEEEIETPIRKRPGGTRKSKQPDSHVHSGRIKKYAVHPAAQKTLPAFAVGAKQVPTNTRYRTRAIHDLHAHAAKDTKIIYTFGPSDGDLTPIILTRDKWVDQPTLPSHKADRNGEGGFEYSFYYTKNIRESEVTHGWNWFHEKGGKECFQNKQEEQALSPTEAAGYLPPSTSHRFVMGPYSKQKLYNLQTGSSVAINDVFFSTAGPNKNPRNGFLLNLGAKPEHIEWVPNKGGPVQYLAISTSIFQRPEKSTSENLEGESTSAFVPSQPFPAAIQIWAIDASVGPGATQTNKTAILRLEAVFCFDWGSVKEIKFCPMMRALEDDGRINLGLAAIVWGDGNTRILNLSYPKLDETQPRVQYIKISSAAFCSSPPSTICTSVTWLSTTTIAAGCANGCVAIWDIPSSLTTSPEQTEIKPRAWFYHNFHPTYILRIVSCWPSRPQMLITASMDGYHRLTDLREPDMDFLLSNRTRVGHESAIWHDQTQGVIFVDENYAFRSMPLRRFFASVFQARAHAAVTVMASSLLHPFVLGGCTSGEVISYNPVRRVLYSKADVYVQTWFKHEWRRGRNSPSAQPVQQPDGPQADDTTNQPSTRESSETSPLSQPMSRITEGYKLEKPKGLDMKGLENSDQGVVYTTIFERECAITALSWNPNLEYAGWAAAGMASGLVRIEDIAL